MWSAFQPASLIRFSRTISPISAEIRSTRDISLVLGVSGNFVFKLPRDIVNNV